MGFYREWRETEFENVEENERQNENGNLPSESQICRSSLSFEPDAAVCNGTL